MNDNFQLKPIVVPTDVDAKRGAMPEEIISRETAIGRLRIKMIELCDDGKSACQVATERGILCKGFKRDNDASLRRRYASYVGAAERLPRSELERAANHWHLARQRAEGALLACDVQNAFYQICRGWNDFSNEELSNFCCELTGIRPKVVGDVSLPIL